MSEELRPCPFCGAMPEKLRTGYMCSTLGCALQENTVSEKEWNTRPIEDALRARIAELEEKQRWIPVSERLPKENAPVLVLTVLGGMFVDFIHGKSVVTGNPDFYELDVEDVTHWMPLPKLPEVQE